MSFGEAISTCFRKYVDFRGYASRPEYWWFVLFYALVYLAAKILDAIVGAGTQSSGFALFSTILLLGMFLPGLAAVVRRLRDAGYGWGWVFITVIPLVGSIVLIVLLAQPTRVRAGVAAATYLT